MPAASSWPRGQCPIFATRTAAQPARDAQDRVERVVVPLPARAVGLGGAPADELHAAGRDVVDEELPGVAEVLVDQTAALRGHRHPDRRRGRHRDPRGDTSAASRSRAAAARTRSTAARRSARSFARVPGRARGEPGEREGVEAVLAEPPHRVGAALPAVAHEPGVELAGPLHVLELRGVGPRWPVRPKWVPCSGAEMRGTRFTRKAPGRPDRPRDVGQVGVVHAGDDDRVHLHEDAPGPQERDALELPLGEDARGLDARGPSARPGRSTGRSARRPPGRSC